MLSQLIVVDFAKGQHPIVYDELTRAYERTLSYSALEEREAFDLHLVNYDKHYSSRADSLVVFIQQELPPAHPPSIINPWVAYINKAYRALLEADITLVTHFRHYTHCSYQSVHEVPPYPLDFNWIEKILPVE